jgi:peptidoglycan hydrolase-like protein with peptidoglycan-binding domain
MPSKTPYGFFGKLTEGAVKLFQEAYGITSRGGPGYGLVGPITRKKLNQLLLGQ